MKWLIGIGALVLVAGGAVAITQTPHWRSTMIRQEWRDCMKRQKNLQKAGRPLESIGLEIKCLSDLNKANAEHFGTTDISQTPAPLWRW